MSDMEAIDRRLIRLKPKTPRSAPRSPHSSKGAG